MTIELTKEDYDIIVSCLRRINKSILLLPIICSSETKSINKLCFDIGTYYNILHNSGINKIMKILDIREESEEKDNEGNIDESTNI